MSIDELLQKWLKEFKKGFAKPLILFYLAEQESYPYLLTKMISKRTKGQIEIATTNIYPILKQLTDDQLVVKIKTDPESQTTRKYYKISEKGREFANLLRITIDEFFTDAIENREGDD